MPVILTDSAVATLIAEVSSKVLLSKVSVSVEPRHAECYEFRDFGGAVLFEAYVTKKNIVLSKNKVLISSLLEIAEKLSDKQYDVTISSL